MPDSSLLQAINDLWILDPKTAAELRSAAGHADAQQTAALITLVKDIERQQTDVLKKLVETDPQFPQKLGEFLRTSLQSKKGEVEATDVAGLSDVASQIDAS